MSKDQTPTYEFAGARGPDRAQVRFTGPFQGRVVVWNATILTLHAWHEQLRAQDRPPAVLRPFIEINPRTATTPEPEITVGLDVERIDHATILKTVVMVRKYKRLAPGRREFGDARAFDDS